MLWHFESHVITCFSRFLFFYSACAFPVCLLNSQMGFALCQGWNSHILWPAHARFFFLRSLGKSARSYISHNRLFNSVAALTSLSRHRDAGNLFTQRFIDIPQQISGEFQHERLVEKWQVKD